ncbi:MAG TPA: NapC/NirT family cytochrome c [Xanthomonadales bacterium]|nr:NapC/NirT family cytochrome c [Xanthomonadales bacterium]
MKQSFLRRWWGWWRSPSAKWALGTLLVVGTLVGVAAGASFNAFLGHTNTMDFCTSCHEMREFVYAEYKESVHYTSASGVRPDCADCHVPKAFIPKMKRKIQATFNEVPGHLMGRIDTREKFEAHRLQMAQNVWASMKASDSRECRNCHRKEAMALEEQKPRARAQHEDALKTGETCIDCHKGIAHKMPDLPEDEEPAQEDDFTL